MHLCESHNKILTKKQEKKGNSLLETKFMVMLSTNNLGPLTLTSHVLRSCEEQDYGTSSATVL